MKSNCKKCGKEITYSPSQSKGIYCSRQCATSDRIKEKFELDTNYTKGMAIHLKKIRGNKCEECGIEDWNGRPLTFQIDHINGNKRDNRQENLKILCPNCHSQTETFGIKNISEESYQKMIEGSMNGYLKRKEIYGK